MIYPHATPDYFAEFAAHARDLGARLIGGCCGTTPTEIAAIRAAIDENAAGPRRALDADERELVAALGEEQRETRLARALREGEFVVSVQLDPPLGGSSRGLLEVARRARGVGPRPVRRRQRQRDRARRHELADGLRRDRARDRARDDPAPDDARLDASSASSRMLLGAHAEGVRNVLAITGDPPEVGDYPGSRGVYEIDAIGLTRLIARPQPRRGLQRPPDRRADRRSSSASPSTRPPTTSRLEAERFRAEARGRREVRDDADRLRPRRARPLRRELGGSAGPAARRRSSRSTSYRLALRLHNEVPGIVVPQELQDALEAAGAERRRGRDGARARAGRRGARALRRRLRRRAVPPADVGARAARLGASRTRAGARRSLLRSSRIVVRRRDRVQPLEHLRVPHLAGAPSGGRHLQRDGAADPDEREPAQTAPTTSPPSESSRRSGGSSRSPPRTNEPTNRASSGTQRARRAPRRARRARCSATHPAGESCGASRAPTTAPATSPASEKRGRRRARSRARRAPSEPTNADEDPVEGCDAR